jgi:hypothetical protein
MHLRYGSLEGPENGVYVRGRLKNKNTIELPDYWVNLVDYDSITVTLTPIGRFSELYVENIENNIVYVQDNCLNLINCYFTVYAERIDIPKLLVGNDLFAVHFENLSNGLHFETGLIVFNLTHPQTAWLRDILTTAYDSLDIYTMKKTWDGYWFAHLYQKYKLPVYNLSEGRHGVFNHPLVFHALVHDVGSKKYTQAGYNEFTGRK